ncbi:hypothetical protein [Vreelandella hamiltonii]|uniref:Uncharacterized protein n=1 Tax=Halomonas johnsoniae TaxID=502832 RepID=A0ABQ2WA52_9GAMM|nr:hypothetical protein [Halomonas johnsoniae]GGW45197.1 hypothetical protein GCM10007158_02270 [Halomonas johnsoniae]
MVTIIATIFVPPSATTLFRGVEVELDRCSPHTRDAIEMALTQGTDKPNPLADLEALEERATAQAVGQLAATMLAHNASSDQVEDALCELRTHMDEHFLQRKLVRLYER